MRISWLAFAGLVAIGAPAAAQTTVRSVPELREALARAGPGAQVLLAPGEYAGGLQFSGIRGAPGKPVVIAAADPKSPPVIRGGGTGLHLSDVVHLELRDLVVAGASHNGINIDDGGSYDTPSQHVVLRNLTVRDVGSKGNHDGIKLSGLDDFRIEACAIERWGTGGGSGIDMVGCHRGVVEGCALAHGDPGGSTGIQMKGGCADITVRRNRFADAGARAINIGGSTGLQYFRPPLAAPPHAEARAIVVEGNTFSGSDAPVAFVGVDGAVVRYNTIYVPKRWAIRILQETIEPGFVACRKGVFEGNVVVFRSTQWGEGGVNVGPNTEAGSFSFARNWWFCMDQPGRSRPRLPAGIEEREGVYGTDPRLRDPEKGDLRLRADSPAKGFGADALK